MTDLPALLSRRPIGRALLAVFVLAGCSPTVKVQGPKDPITINLNIKLDAEVRVRLEEVAKTDIEENPDIFGGTAARKP